MTAARRLLNLLAAIPGVIAALIVEKSLVLQVFGTLLVVAGAAGTTYRLTVWLLPELGVWPAATVLGALLAFAAPGWRRLANHVEERETA